MSGGQEGWILLFLLGIFLIVIGVQGNLGCTLCIIFSPADVLIGTNVPTDPNPIGTF